MFSPRVFAPRVRHAHAIPAHALSWDMPQVEEVRDVEDLDVLYADADKVRALLQGWAPL